MSQSIPQKLKTEVQEFLQAKYPEDEAYRKELRFNDLYTLLQNGVAHWWFEKTDGTDRNAFGTLNKDLLEELIGENDNSSQSAWRLTSTTALSEHFRCPPFSGSVPSGSRKRGTPDMLFIELYYLYYL